MKKIYEEVPEKAANLNKLTESEYVYLFRIHPFQEKGHAEKLFDILENKKLLDLFNL